VNPTGRRANDLNKQLEGVTCKLEGGGEGRKAGWKFSMSSGEDMSDVVVYRVVATI